MVHGEVASFGLLIDKTLLNERTIKIPAQKAISTLKIFGELKSPRARRAAAAEKIQAVAPPPGAPRAAAGASGGPWLGLGKNLRAIGAQLGPKLHPAFTVSLQKP